MTITRDGKETPIAARYSATATVAEDRLAVMVGEYQLGCQRDGAA